jgi:beta-lactamase class A
VAPPRTGAGITDDHRRRDGPEEGPTDGSAGADADRLRRVVAQLGAVEGAVWSVAVCEAPAGGPVSGLEPDRVVPIASVGKLLLLLEAARRIDEGTLDGSVLLRRRPDDEVADSGLWQHLTVSEMTVDDLGVLIGAVSDNLATNVLLRHVGLEAVQALGQRLGLVETRLLDRVRDLRTDADPPTLAVGNAAELSQLLVGLSRGTAVSPGVCSRVRGWLTHGADLSMVAAPFGLDPLARGETDVGSTLINKTGTDPGIRADVGVVTRAGRGLAYAVLARFEPGRADTRHAVLEGMHRVGIALRTYLG